MRSRLLEWLPAWASPLLAWAADPGMLGVIAAVSVVTFLLSLVGVPWFLARVPADYFSAHERAAAGIDAGDRSRWQVALRVGRNALGVLLLLAGIAMLLLPGNGIVTIFLDCDEEGLNGMK